MAHRPILAAVLAISVPLVATPLLAMGGGGGGGGSSSPSQSAPQYDPAEEYRKGMEAMKAKDFKAAKRAFDRVVAAAPKDANSQYLAGLSRTSMGDYKGSKKFLEKAVKLDPKLIGAHRELGVAYARLGDKAKAGGVLSALQAEAQKCNSNCGQAADINAAIAAVQAALSGGTTTGGLMMPSDMQSASANWGDSQYLGAVALINEQRYEDAILSLKAAKASFGPHPDVLTYLGFANRKLKRFDVAEDYYRQALAIAPTHRGATEYFGELMVERGDLAGARKMLAQLDSQCHFGCAEADELRRWITAGRAPLS